MTRYLESHTIAYSSADAAERRATPGEYIMLDGITGKFWIMDAAERTAVQELRIFDDVQSVYRWTTWGRK